MWGTLALLILHQAGSGKSLEVTHGYSAHQSLDFGHRPYNGNLVYFCVLELGLVKNKSVIAPNSELRKGGKQVGERAGNGYD